MLWRPPKRAIASGMDRFVSKPVNIDPVGGILHEYFPRRPESNGQESRHNVKRWRSVILTLAQ